MNVSMGKQLALASLAVLVSLPAESVDIKADKVDVGPTLDGKADDACWKSAKEYKVDLLGVGDLIDTKLQATFKVVQASTSAHFLLIWSDTTKNDQHKSYEWNDDKNFYEEKNELEDQVSLAFELKGPFTANMLSPVRGRLPLYWDVWQWGAARTNNGYAKDLFHVYSSKALPRDAENLFQGRDRGGKIVWMARPSDSGTPVWEEVKMTSAQRKTKGEAIVSRFKTQKPSGGAADVLAKGAWADGKWTLEMSRKLKTKDVTWSKSRSKLGAPDTQFEAGKPIKMAIATFDHIEGNTHYASESIRITF